MVFKDDSEEESDYDQDIQTGLVMSISGRLLDSPYLEDSYEVNSYVNSRALGGGNSFFSPEQQTRPPRETTLQHQPRRRE